MRTPGFLVPSLFLTYSCVFAIQAPTSATSGSTPYQTGAFVETLGCTVQSIFGQFCQGDSTDNPHGWCLETLITLAELNQAGPAPWQNVTDPFTGPPQTITNYITSDQYEYGMEVSFVPVKSGNTAGTVNYHYADWSGSADLVYPTKGIDYATEVLKFPCWIHGP